MSVKDTIDDGVSPKKILKKRGVSYDGTGFFPQVPDFVGYLLGFLLIWLLYTGFGAVSGVLTQSKKTVSALSNKAKVEAMKSVEKFKDDASDLMDNQQKLTRVAKEKLKRARLSETVEVEEVGSWSAQQLKKANKLIDSLTAKAGKSLSGIFTDYDFDEQPEIETVSEEEESTNPRRNDSLDRF
jgi:hypothetical protein